MTMSDVSGSPSGQRLVALAGGRNFRDLGGYVTEDGKQVRWGRLFRAGSPVGLTDGDWTQLCRLGIKAVCDLRTKRERDREPFRWADAPDLHYWSGEFEASFAELRETMHDGFANGVSAVDGMIAGYRQLPFDQAPAYREIFGHLKAGRAPIIFNCTAGKDRTGVAAALILRALKVSRETVIEDYILTNEILAAEKLLMSRPGGRLSTQSPDVIEAIGRADGAYISAALDSIERGPGGINSFLSDHIGISREDMQTIRALLLE